MRITQPGFKGGDRTTIALPTVQTDFLKALKTTGKPVVFVMMTGSAIAIPWEATNIPAIVDAWYGGQAAGNAVADVLFGDYDPSGRLPVTFYKGDSDLPSFEDYSMANRTYRYFKGDALYPFGFGLSYTTFKYSDLKLSKTEVDENGSVKVELTVTNTGKVKGDEVMQLYLSHEDISYAPLYALKGFQRITLAPGESHKVSFMLTPELLRLVDETGKQSFIPGKMKVIVGGSSPAKNIGTLGAAKQAEAILVLK
jgi:beta-glucosidase